MSRNVMGMLLAVLLMGGCAANPRPDAAPYPPQPRKAVSQSPVAASPQKQLARVQRLDHVPTDTRPDCGSGRVVRAISGHTGAWEASSLRGVAAGLLRHPGGANAAISPGIDGRATIVLYRPDGTRKATFRLSRLDDRWFPDSVTACEPILR